MILQSRANNLLAVVEVFRANKAHHGIGKQRREMSRHGVGAGFAGLLIHSLVGISGERRTLAGFKIHDILALGAALE